NENHQPLTSGDGNGTYTWTYDGYSRPKTQTDVWGITLTNTWDDADRLTQVVDSSTAPGYISGTRTYEFFSNDLSKVQKFQASGLPVARLDFEYNGRNDLTRVWRYKDLTLTDTAHTAGSTAYTLDDDRRLVTLTHNSSLLTIDSQRYSYFE